MNFRNILGFVLVALALVACAASAPPAVGVWEVEMNTPVGSQQVTLTVAADGTGSFAGPQGEQLINGISFDGNSIDFETTIEAQGQSITLAFSGSIDGDTISGEFNTPFGALSVSGSRQ